MEPTYENIIKITSYLTIAICSFVGFFVLIGGSKDFTLSMPNAFLNYYSHYWLNLLFPYIFYLAICYSHDPQLYPSLKLHLKLMKVTNYLMLIYYFDLLCPENFYKDSSNEFTFNKFVEIILIIISWISSAIIMIMSLFVAFYPAKKSHTDSNEQMESLLDNDLSYQNTRVIIFLAGLVMYLMMILSFFPFNFINF